MATAFIAAGIAVGLYALLRLSSLALRDAELPEDDGSFDFARAHGDVSAIPPDHAAENMRA